MQAFYESLQRIGLQSVDTFWFPMFIWTLVALVIFLGMKALRRLNPLYHYHLRAATLAAIPIGLLAALTVQYINSLNSGTGNFDAAVFVVETPQTLYLADPSLNTGFDPNWFEPNFLIGAVTVLILLVSVFMLFRLVGSYRSLKKLHASLSKTKLSQLSQIEGSGFDHVKLSFHEHPLVPFTFGWQSPIIVLPKSIQDDPEKVRMAIQHELVHIKRGDYLLQLFLSVIESLFWFHPLIKLGAREIETYREISCDQEVLNTSGISLKNYASMLYELLPLNRGLGSFSVSMAVQQSTLKKRIMTMKYHKMYKTSVKRSLFFLFVMILGVTLPIACSDLRGPQGLSEEELMEKQVSISSPKISINGIEIPSPDINTGVPMPSSVVVGTKEYGTFVLSPFPFEGGTNSGLTVANEIDIEVNNLNLMITSGDLIISDKEATIWSKHYPNIKTPSESSEIFFTTINGEKLNDPKYIRSLYNSKVIRAMDPPPPPTEEDYFVVVEEMPKLVGGLRAIQSKVQYPEMARRAGIEGRVTLQFIVNEQGQVENPKVIRGIGGGCDEEALRVVSEAQFEPGYQRGRPVRVQYSLPIIFRLSDSDFTSQSSGFIPQVIKTTDNMLTIKVTTSDGDPVSGANVVISGTNKGAATNQEGIATITGLDAGGYDFEVRFVGSEPAKGKVNISN
jgi:TonB family protein